MSAYHEAYGIVSNANVVITTEGGKFELYSDEMEAWTMAAKFKKDDPKSIYTVKKTHVPLPWVRS